MCNNSNLGAQKFTEILTKQEKFSAANNTFQYNITEDNCLLILGTFYNPITNVSFSGTSIELISKTVNVENVYIYHLKGKGTVTVTYNWTPAGERYLTAQVLKIG